MQQLFPDNRTVPIESVYTDLSVRDRIPEGRPYVLMNMVASADGRAVVEGKSRPLGSEIDRSLLVQLRTQADAVFAGTGTIGIENYKRPVRNPEQIEIRCRLGLRPEPVMAIVSRSMELPLSVPLFQDPDSRIVVFTNSETEVEGLPGTVEIVRTGRGELHLKGVFERLRSDFDVEVLLAEGGPSINAAILAEGLVDELFLTVSPKLIGGHDPMTIIHGDPFDGTKELELVSVCTEDSFLFLRYRIDQL